MVQAPQGQLLATRRVGRAERQVVPGLHARPTDAGHHAPGCRGSLLRHAADRQARDSRAAGGPRAHRRARRAAGAAADSARSNPTTTRDVQVRLEPPQASVLSTFHYVNLGGAEFVVYRATPADVESGVRVGDRDVSRLSRHRGRHQERSRRARRVLRAARTTRT